MSEINLTDEQKEIINCDKNTVVIAVPGSGKTTTLAYKINEILKTSFWYNGVIAISYTNKASEELKHRVQSLSKDICNSFFGTIYKFYTNEIIIPFARYLFNYYGDVCVEQFKDKNKKFEDLKDDEKIKCLIDCYINGIIILEGIPFFAKYIFDNSESCKLYLKSRYKYIIIDEYQDCDEIQHQIFASIVNLGIKGVAVGDPDQSIFKYAGSSPKFLLELSNDKTFKSFGLTFNHRCHKSISNYAYKFLFSNKKYDVLTDKRVFKWIINGAEDILSSKIDALIPKIIKKYDVENNSKIAILYRYKTVAELLINYLKTPFVYYCDTPLDKSSYPHDILFSYLLSYVYGSDTIFPETIIDYLDFKINNKKNAIMNKIINYRKHYLSNGIVLFDEMICLIKSIYGEDIDLCNINEVISNELYLRTYMPMDSNKIRVMSIHKSKGLEFDAVIILDLHKYIIPSWDFDNNIYKDLEEDKCIHYVSITRAKKLVIFAVNTKRHNSKGNLKDGIESEFISNSDRPDLISYRN